MFKEYEQMVKFKIRGTVTKALSLVTLLLLISILTACQPLQKTDFVPANSHPTADANQGGGTGPPTLPTNTTSPYDGIPVRPGGESPFPTTTEPGYSFGPPTSTSASNYGAPPTGYPGTTPNGYQGGSYSGIPTPPGATVSSTKIIVTSTPVSDFTTSDIQKLGINISGTPREIADSIRKWQETNMAYGASKPDFSDAIRWNYFLPGIFPSHEIINEHIDNNGRVYGICFDFAVIYSSIAKHYGLETRVRNSISKPSDTDKTIQFTTGMSPDEFARLATKLGTKGYKYDFDAVRRVASETPSHYWAEVKIDGVWIIEDATQAFTGNNTQTGYVNKNDVQLTDWMSNDKSAVLYDYQSKIDSGQRLPEF